MFSFGDITLPVATLAGRRYDERHPQSRVGRVPRAEIGFGRWYAASAHRRREGGSF